MRTLVVTIAAIIVLAVCATAVFAADFECTVEKVGDRYTYTLKNNHPTLDVIQWCLRWSCNDVDNAVACQNNFYTFNGSGYITTPAKWDRVEDSGQEPQWYTDDAQAGDPIRCGGNQKSFTIAYRSPNSTPASLFKVGFWVNNTFAWSTCMNVIPEPGTIAILLTGLAGTGILFKRKTR